MRGFVGSRRGGSKGWLGVIIVGVVDKTFHRLDHALDVGDLLAGVHVQGHHLGLVRV